ncbi:protein eva-1 homolog C-like, partial [Limulus polyphemus]|uniref:Protein eva-1 homolog C-like n=1 Tax=Limulus polyphemus TaxID=6850 RepID=A0ABM1BF58_LIMPO
LLSGTLRNFQVHACDGTELVIKCWPNTVIAISFALYGRTVPSHELCPREQEISKDIYLETNGTNCLAPQALRTVEERCRHQRICRIKTAPESFGKDPCPGVRKYAEVVYKCRPSSFINKIVCEHERLQIECEKSRRIVIYSASFGGTHHGIYECPQKTGKIAPDCQGSYTTETVMQGCLGRRRCSILASVQTFGKPGCPAGTRHYLKVVYTCVSKEILRKLDTDGQKNTEIDKTDYFVEKPRFVAPPVGQNRTRWKGSLEYTITVGKSTTTTKHKTVVDQPVVQGGENMDGDDTTSNCTVIEGDQKVVGFLTEWIAAYKFLKENKEKCILYLTLSLGAGLVVFFLVLSIRLYAQKKKERKKANLNISEPLPTSFDEYISDLEHLDNTDRPGVEARRESRSTMRRQDSDTYPRAPMSQNMNNYYYS